MIGPNNSETTGPGFPEYDEPEIDTSGFRVLGTNVLVRSRTDRKTKGGLHLPENVQEGITANRCEVLAVGDGKIPGVDGVHEFRVKVGDYVIVHANAVQGTLIEGENLGVISEEFILVVLP